MSEPKTETIEAQGAEISYDVREADSESDAPILMMIGSPMAASGFATLGEHFRDRTVVTYDPRGADRSQRTDGAEQSTPDEHADDLHRVISAVGRGPVDLFAEQRRSRERARAGGQASPRTCGCWSRTNRPAAQVLPDREEALAAAVDIHETYERDGIGPAMAKFMVLGGIEGTGAGRFRRGAGPQPRRVRASHRGRRQPRRSLVGQNMVTGTRYEHDFDALRAAPTRIVVAAGVESEGELTYRAALAVAERLGTEAASSPATTEGSSAASRVAGRPGRVRPQAARGPRRGRLTRAVPCSGGTARPADRGAIGARGRARRGAPRPPAGPKVCGTVAITP